MVSANGISIVIEKSQVSHGQEVTGRITLTFHGRFDSIVINSNIENSNDTFGFTSLNGAKINHPYARFSILRDDIGDSKTLEFTARTEHTPLSEYTNAKFRVAVIQEHKEVASDLAFVRITK
jgi:hypothetical protein